MLRKFITVSVVAGLTVALAGCGASTPEKIKPSPTTTPEKVVSLGESVIVDEVTDEFGTYQRTTVDPEADVMKTDREKWNMEWVEKTGYTEEEILEGQQFVFTFVAEQVADGIALDRNMAGWEQWVAEESTKYLDPTYIDDMTLKAPTGADRNPIIYGDVNNITPVMVRDGGPRIISSDFNLELVNPGLWDNEPYLSIHGSSDVDYRVTDEEAIKQILEQNPGSTKEDAIEAQAFLGDGEDNLFNITLTWYYSCFEIDGKWVVAGYDIKSNNYGYGEIE